MELGTLLAVVLVVALVLAALAQWVLDSPLLELGTASWFPAGGDISAARALARGAAAGLVPLAATVVAAILVVAAPFRVWVWGVVALLAATVALSPVLAVYRYGVRPPTAQEQAVLDDLPPLDCEVLVVAGTRDGPVNGYAIGGPFRDVVGISEFALQRLSPAQVAAVLAHETYHHERRHVLVRGGVSVAVLAVGAALVTVLFDALVPLATLLLVGTVCVERVLGHWVMRRLEYRADAAAARHTSVETVVSLLAALDGATRVDQARVPRLLRLFSTHPSYADRIAHLRNRTLADAGSSAPATAQ